MSPSCLHGGPLSARGGGRTAGFLLRFCQHHVVSWVRSSCKTPPITTPVCAPFPLPEFPVFPAISFVESSEPVCDL